jgi:hypothetical protein
MKETPSNTSNANHQIRNMTSSVDERRSKATAAKSRWKVLPVEDAREAVHGRAQPTAVPAPPHPTEIAIDENARIESHRRNGRESRRVRVIRKRNRQQLIKIIPKMHKKSRNTRRRAAAKVKKRKKVEVMKICRNTIYLMTILILRRLRKENKFFFGIFFVCFASTFPIFTSAQTEDKWNDSPVIA